MAGAATAKTPQLPRVDLEQALVGAGRAGAPLLVAPALLRSLAVGLIRSSTPCPSHEPSPTCTCEGVTRPSAGSSPPARSLDGLS